MIRLAAVGDVHVDADVLGRYRPALEHLPDHADVLLLAGDLTRHGTEAEARCVAQEFGGLPVPVIAVLGNHDYEAGRQDEITQILVDAGVRVLDGEVTEVHGVGFAGVKGFCGGFGRGALGPWGEAAIKQFVQVAVDEALKLEAALARLRTQSRVALLHYSPIRGTVEGEPVEIFPYLGSSRLEEPINRYRVSAVFHGHAHRGAPEGKTSTGVPVYNVAMPLLSRLHPDRPPFLILELPLDGEAPSPRPGTQLGDPLVRTA